MIEKTETFGLEKYALEVTFSWGNYKKACQKKGLREKGLWQKSLLQKGLSQIDMLSSSWQVPLSSIKAQFELRLALSSL